MSVQIYALFDERQHAAPQVLGSAPSCRHDETETDANRALRQQAIALARSINHAERHALATSGRYAAVTQLSGLPAVPNGFVVRLYMNGDGYAFSIKNLQDPCRYGIFSDQDGTIYEQTPRRPLIATR